jgi:hypothetical protein
VDEHLLPSLKSRLTKKTPLLRSIGTADESHLPIFNTGILLGWHDVVLRRTSLGLDICLSSVITITTTMVSPSDLVESAS